MTRITLKIDGMACGMCEAHINDAVREVYRVKKIVSSHRKGTTVILTDQEIDEEALRDIIDKTGYKVISISEEPYEKKKLFGI